MVIFWYGKACCAVGTDDDTECNGTGSLRGCRPYRIGLDIYLNESCPIISTSCSSLGSYNQPSAASSSSNSLPFCAEVITRRRSTQRVQLLPPSRPLVAGLLLFCNIVAHFHDHCGLKTVDLMIHRVAFVISALPGAYLFSSYYMVVCSSAAH